MIAGIIGNGLGLVLIGLGVIAMKHIKGGKKWEAWAMRGIIVLMFLGGTALLLTGIGGWINSGMLMALGLLGAKGAEVVATLLFVFLLFEVVMGLIRKPSSKSAWSAVFLAFALTLPLAGAPAQLAANLHATATQYAAQIGAKLGV